jgi:penicillin-binding protein 1A
VWLRRLVFSVLLIGIAAGSGLIYVVWQIPLPSGEPPLQQTTYMCASDVDADCSFENSMAQLSGGVDRVSVAYEQVPAVFVLALLATEDRQFFEHAGVDPFAVARALVSDLRDDDLRQGGSTITQQYVKNAYLTAERTWERKIREAVLAIKLERELPKQEILERYLNTIYWGRGAYGIQAAARTYFGVNVEDLNLAQSAYLAGIIRSPESADANRQPDDPSFADQRQAATVRRSAVLAAMVSLGWITPEQRDEVEEGGWDYVLPRETQTNYGKVVGADIGTEYFVDYTRRWLVERGIFTDDQIYGGGLRIYTTIDLGDQEAAANAVRSTLDRPDDPQASLVSLDDAGGITAMIGGFDFAGDQVNLATGTFGGGSGRQPGSSFKALTLATALQEGVPLSRTYDSPGRMKIDLGGGGEWDVGNYADSGMGQLNLVDATRNSSNTAYAHGRRGRRRRRHGDPHGCHRRHSRGASHHARSSRRVRARHDHGVLGIRPAGRKGGAVAGAQGHRRQRHGAVGGAVQPGARARSRGGRHHELGVASGGGERHRHLGAHRSGRRRQDGHGGELPRRLVHWVYVSPDRRRMGWLRRYRDPVHELGARD